MSFEHLLAPRTARMGVNAIREILKVVGQPGMVSLAGGIPAPQSFPMDILRDLSRQGKSVLLITHDEEVAKLKLATMGIEIDVLTAAQTEYLNSWTTGT